MDNKYLKIFVVLIAVILIAPQITFASWWNPISWGWLNRIFHFQQTQKQTACTMEAKLCPDGSSVGRQGPKCEFAPCPIDQISGWKTYTDPKQRFNIKYPSNWKTVQDFKNDDVIFCPTGEDNCSINAVYVYVYTKGGVKDLLNNWRRQGSAYKETNIVIDGSNVIEREESLCTGTPLLTNGVFIEGSSYDYQIQGPISECGSSKDKIQADYDQSLQIFNQMLPTFKFTK